MNTISEKNSQDSHVSTGATLAPADKVLTRVPSGTSAGLSARTLTRPRPIRPRIPTRLPRRQTVRFPSPSPNRPSAHAARAIATESGCCWPEPWPRWRWAVTSWSRGSIRHSAR